VALSKDQLVSHARDAQTASQACADAIRAGDLRVAVVALAKLSYCVGVLDGADAAKYSALKAMVEAARHDATEAADMITAHIQGARHVPHQRPAATSSAAGLGPRAAAKAAKRAGRRAEAHVPESWIREREERERAAASGERAERARLSALAAARKASPQEPEGDPAVLAPTLAAFKKLEDKADDVGTGHADPEDLADLVARVLDAAFKAEKDPRATAAQRRKASSIHELVQNKYEEYVDDDGYGW
jgi:hypothetical protein